MSCWAIVGSRKFENEALVRAWLSVHVPPGTTIISGGAAGPDSWAEQWAHEHGMTARIYHADWKKWGRAAGVKRNAQIVADADKLVAFWDGMSRGTQNSIQRARAKGIPVIILTPHGTHV